MEKLEGKSMNIAAENISRMKELFPEVFCENKIDFERLQEVLGEYTEDKEERYSFNWKGKSKAIRIAQTPSTGTLRPCREESKNFDTTENLYIEGDNLEVLKLLQKTYHGKVKMIYIDPPYNTGNDFVYPDDFRDNIKNYLEITGQVDGDGKKIGTNSEASGRYHTDWLNMMYPRLKLARNLLSDDGAIYISIDDNEVDNLKKICNEILGEENFIGTILWKKKTNGNNMGLIPPVHDYVCVYAKNINGILDMGYDVTKEFMEKTYANPDNDMRGPWTTMDLSANHKGPYFVIKNPITGQEFTPPDGRYWVFNEIDVLKRIADGRVIFGKSGNARPVQKVFAAERKKSKIRAESWWDNHGMNEDATEELKFLLDAPKIFIHPKPSKLVYHLAKILTNSGSIILDFFSGSATTAHSLMQLNSEDCGKRKFIMVQIPELINEKDEAFKFGYKNICEVGKERIRRAGEKILQENKDKEGTENLDIGFKVFKLDSSNIKKWDVDGDNLEISIDNMIDNFVGSRTEEDIVYEIMIKYGIDLTYPVEMRKIVNKKVFSIGFGALFICLDDEITLEVVKGIVKFKDELTPEITRVVFKDNGFKNDSVKTNAIQILRRNKIQEIMSI